jgi:hypothetical protein
MNKTWTALIASIVLLPLFPAPAEANSGDFSGGVAIGTGYAGVDAAPSNGLLVQGSVGIGTTSPGNTLDVGSGGGIHITSGVPGSTSMPLYNNSGTLTWNGIALATGSSVSGTSNYIPIFTGANSLGNSTIYESSGFVGIGTTSPSAPLNIYTTNDPSLTLNHTGTSGNVGLWFDQNGTDEAYIWLNISNNALNVGTRATNPSITILSAGDVGIGTSSPAYLLHVGSSAASGIVMELQNSSGACTHSPGASSETVSCSSDARLKRDIEDSKRALAWADDMRIRDFTVKATSERKTGVVAQELLLKHPDMVHKDKAGLYSVDEPNPWMLVKTVQELHSLVLEQKEEINTLKQTLTQRKQPTRDGDGK